MLPPGDIHLNSLEHFRDNVSSSELAKFRKDFLVLAAACAIAFVIVLGVLFYHKGSPESPYDCPDYQSYDCH